MKRSIWFLAPSLLLVAAWMMSACGSNGSAIKGAGSTQKSADTGNQPATADKKAVTIEVATNIVGEPAKVLENIAKKFMQEHPDIKVEFSAPGAEYENIMKVKRASNSLPDVFSTHGWAKIRYGLYVADLKDQPWVSRIDDTIKSAVTDDKGKVYALPIDQDIAGPMYNADVLQKYGVQVPTTWDELVKVAEEIKTKSNGEVAPIHIGGADGWPIGQFVDFFATSLLISPTNNSASQLLDGSFDWKNFDKLPEMLAELQKKGLLNKDVLTSKYEDSAKAFALGKAAFGFYGPFLIGEAKKTNPNVKVGLMPIPSIAAGDTPTFAGGEKTTWGVWKDSSNPEAAKKFVAYYARPENAALVAAANALPPGIKGVAINAGSLTADFAKYKDVRVFPYFDRAYLPNGMWDVITKNGQDLLAGGITTRQYSDNMKKEYDRLRPAGK